MSTLARVFSFEIDIVSTVIARNFSNLNQSHNRIACYLIGEEANTYLYATVIDRASGRDIQFTSTIPPNTLPQFPKLVDLAELLYIAHAALTIQSLSVRL